MLERLEMLISNPFMLCGGILLGFGMGVLTGLFGAGGGFITTPALNIFLGLPMNMAVGTSSCQILGTSGIAFYHHFDKRMPGIRVALLTGIGIPAGAFLGSSLVSRLVGMGTVTVNGRELSAINFILLVVFAVFLSMVAGWLLFDNFVLRRGKEEDESKHRGYLSYLNIKPTMKFRTIPYESCSVPLLVVLGVLLGFLGGLLGIGGGVIMMPLLFYLVGQETKFAANTSNMLVFATSLFATFSHAASRNIDYVLVAALLVGAFLGTGIGARIQRKIQPRKLRQHFGFVVLGAVGIVMAKLANMILG